MKRTLEEKEQALKIDCPACGAKVGNGCKRLSGRGNHDGPVHDARFNRAQNELGVLP